MVVAGVEEGRQLPGGDLLAGAQASVLSRQGGGVLPSCEHKAGGTCMDGTVRNPLVLEGEGLPALLSVPGEQLRGGGRASSPHQKEPLAGHC